MIYSLLIHLKLDIRNRGVLLTYYLMPIGFFLFFGGVLISMNPDNVNTITSSMAIFSIVIGSTLGTPIPLIEFYETQIKKAYKVGNVPLWLPAFLNFVSACVHLFIMTLIICILSPLLFSGKIPSNIPLFLLTMILFLLTSVSIGTVLGLFVKTTSRLTLVGQMIFLPSIMLSGILFPKGMLPDILGTISYIFPATIANEVISSNQLGSLGLLVSILLIMITISIFKIRKIKDF